jgi:hypothetical protein
VPRPSEDDQTIAEGDEAAAEGDQTVVAADEGGQPTGSGSPGGVPVQKPEQRSQQHGG